MTFRRHIQYHHPPPDRLQSTLLSAVDLNSYMDLDRQDFAHLNPLWSDLLDRFQGDFDNYHQVQQDRSEGKLPRDGGGHEHIHCTLVPLSPNTRLAAFYFDGVPQAIFRFRFYQLVPASIVTGNSQDTTIYTILYTLHPDLERQLRAVSQEPLTWPAIYQDYVATVSNDASSIRTLLPKCEVEWSWDRDPILHAYAETEPPHAIHAVMVHGQALVDSQMSPGQQILIKDQLSLWNNALWIHDRGFDPVTMEFIYGNRENVPYKMERVTVFDAGNTEDDTSALTSRVVSDSDLEWTLGPQHRTPEEYQAKMNAIGGPSIPPRPTKSS